MPEADADYTTRPGPEITLSSLAETLGDFDPPAGFGDVHLKRLNIIRAAATFLPVRTPADATLAISLALDHLAELRDGVWSEDQLHERLNAIRAILARVSEWMTEAHGVPPLRVSWPRHIRPFPVVAA